MLPVYKVQYLTWFTGNLIIGEGAKGQEIIKESCQDYPGLIWGEFFNKICPLDAFPMASEINDSAQSMCTGP